jgi:hypothetical protein
VLFNKNTEEINNLVTWQYINYKNEFYEVFEIERDYKLDSPITKLAFLSMKLVKRLRGYDWVMYILDIPKNFYFKTKTLILNKLEDLSIYMAKSQVVTIRAINREKNKDITLKQQDFKLIKKA